LSIAQRTRIGEASSLIAQLVVLLLVCAQSAWAQLPNEDYRGVAATGLALRKLETTARVLVIGAHPDDEDTQLLAALSLRDGADVAYLSLTRGEGGQNSIGGELGPALGILRTGELLAARGLDRSQQFFTRAYDFGFSKNAEETFRHWPRDSILADVVSVVRRYKPDVIIAIFTGTPRDGHGQHQVSGMLAREAFRAAADPGRFPEQLRNGMQPHRTLKLFQATGYRQALPTQLFATGALDPLLGRSYAQIAAASRSRHRSQDMGQAQAPGARTTSVRLLESVIPVTDSTVFGAMSITLSARAIASGESNVVNAALHSYDSLIVAARASLLASSSTAAQAHLSVATRTLREIVPTIRDEHLRFAADRELAEASAALLQASSIAIDALSTVENIVPGSTFALDVTVWNGGSTPIRIVRLSPLVPVDWRITRTDSTSDLVQPDSLVRRSYSIAVPADAAISQPYFLARPRPGDVYAWPGADSTSGTPFGAPPARVAGVIDVAGASADFTRTATRRIVDPRQGELRRALHVTPAFQLQVAPHTAVIPLGALTSGARRSIDATVEVSSAGTGGTVTIEPVLPAGWQATPRQVAVTLAAAGESRSAKFAIAPPRTTSPRQYDINFVATDSAGRKYTLDRIDVDYPHIVNRVLFEPAAMRVTVLDARYARGTRVGYVVGVDEPVAQVLQQAGVMLERLDESALANGELGIYDAIVIGSRAYEVRPELSAHNSRLLDYARKGGNLIVLYQQYEFIQGGYAPFAMTLNRPHDRVTDETALVRMIDSTALALTRPNRISQRDFDGWLQERALYMPATWAAPYAPLLEMSDPGEPPQRGAVLTAKLGEGLYTYTGLAFFRQLPAGVPGALRLFINLLSMGITDVNF
jgi:LmbE family N-acetylglucosaminyl deacetylase